MVNLNIMWDVVSKGADIVGIISLGISLVTLLNTGKIRSSMIAHVETSEYRKEIDEQIGDLEVFRDILIKGEGLNSQVFLKLITQLENIRISYVTILPTKLLKRIATLYEHISTNLYDVVTPYEKKHLEKCNMNKISFYNRMKSSSSICRELIDSTRIKKNKLGFL